MMQFGCGFSVLLGYVWSRGLCSAPLSELNKGGIAVVENPVSPIDSLVSLVGAVFKEVRDFEIGAEEREAITTLG